MTGKSSGPAVANGAGPGFLAFRLNGNEFGLPIDAVDEVARAPEQITRLPKTPKFLEGMINLRGEVLPVVDQRRRFDMPALENGAGRRLVVVRTEQHRAGLIVDSVTEVLRSPAAHQTRAGSDRRGPCPGARRRELGRRRPDGVVAGPGRTAQPGRTRLAGQLQQVAGGRSATAAPVIKLLVVDDFALMRRLIGGIFGQETDFEVRFARNGLEALVDRRRYAPDVITLDIHMPQMDGLEVLDRIMIERPCPVVMVSSLTADGAEATLEALRLGAVDFIAKPRERCRWASPSWPRCWSKSPQAAGARLKRACGSRSACAIGSAVAQGPEPSLAAKLLPSAAAGQGLVLVGLSTGGPPALEALLTPLPAEFPWPIVIAQHMPATFTGAAWPDVWTTLRDFRRGSRGLPLLKPGFAYIARGDGDVIICGGRWPGGDGRALAQDYPWHPSVDRLVRSAMNLMPPSQLIGVLMTGMGNDGALAMRDCARGGRTIAEAEDSAVVWGMPGELVKADGADLIEPLPSRHRRRRRKRWRPDMPLIRNRRGRPDAPAFRPTERALRGAPVGPDEERWRAARALAAFPQAAAVLGEALARGAGPAVREAMFTSLARIGGPDGRALVPHFRSEDAALRTGAMDALKAIPEGAPTVLAGPARGPGRGRTPAGLRSGPRPAGAEATALLPPSWRRTPRSTCAPQLSM